jgi:hypothetical protein
MVSPLLLVATALLANTARSQNASVTTMTSSTRHTTEHRPSTQSWTTAGWPHDFNCPPYEVKGRGTCACEYFIHCRTEAIHLSDPLLATDMTNKTEPLLECIDDCDAEIECISAVFDSRSNKCFLYNVLAPGPYRTNHYFDYMRRVGTCVHKHCPWAEIQDKEPKRSEYED